MAKSDELKMNSNERFSYRVLLATSIVIGLVLLIIGLWYAVQVLLITFAGVLLATVFRIPARWLAKRTSLSQSWSVVLVIILLIAMLVVIGMFAAPQVINQSTQLKSQIPSAMHKLEGWLQQYSLGQWVLSQSLPINNLGNEFQRSLSEALGVANQLIQVISGVLILLFVSIYFSFNPNMYVKGILHMVPFSQRDKAAEVLGLVGYTLHWWLIGSFMHMSIVGVVTFIGLWLLDIPLAFLLALLVFFLDFVPYFGPIFASIPAILVAFTLGPEQAVYVMLLYVAVQQLEGLIMDPVIYNKTLYLPPVLTVLSQILLYTMAGYLGMILATPLMAVALVLVKVIYVKHILGDDQVDQLDEAAKEGYIPAIPASK